MATEKLDNVTRTERNRPRAEGETMVIEQEITG